MRSKGWTTVSPSERRQHPEWNGISRIECDSTGKLRFRTHVSWTDANGVKHQSETRICSSTAECLKEAKLLRKAKEGIIPEVKSRRSLRLIDAYEHYMEDIRRRASRVTTEATTGDIDALKNAQALYKHYIPDNIRAVKISDLTPGLIGEWLAWINSTDLSGNSVRRYKTQLSRFCDYLRDKGYIDDDTDLKRRLDATTIKSKATGARTDRVCPSVDDLLHIIDYYRKRGLNDFRTLSWMCLWVVLFCTGARVEELIALRISSVDFVRNTITLDDAISAKELPGSTALRAEAGVKRMKNGNSARAISIMRFYRDLLETYIQIYKQTYDITDGWLFPRLTPTAELSWNLQKNILRELNRVKKATNVADGIDAQMFRHGCATFLIRDMDLSYDAVYAYFGHSSSDMLRTVYGKLNLGEKQARANAAMSALLADSVASIDPAKQKRQDVMMLRGEWLQWMQDILADIKKDE